MENVFFWENNLFNKSFFHQYESNTLKIFTAEQHQDQIQQPYFII